MDGFTVCGHLPSQADHSDRKSTPPHDIILAAHSSHKEEASALLFCGEGEALHSKDHQSKLLHQGSSSPQADGIATAVYRMAVTQAPANPLMLPALWSPEQEAMAQVSFQPHRQPFSRDAYATPTFCMLPDHPKNDIWSVCHVPHTAMARLIVVQQRWSQHCASEPLVLWFVLEG